MRKLTQKQKDFIEYYLGECNGNATAAAIKAGYSEKSAKVLASDTLTKANVIKEIEKRNKSLADKTDVTVESIAEMHQESFDVAKESKNSSAMTAAAKNLADLFGFNKHNHKHITIDDNGNDAGMQPLVFVEKYINVDDEK